MPIVEKQSVLVCVFCLSERQGWVNPWLAHSLCVIAKDTRFNVAIELPINFRPLSYGRNRAMALARERRADWLVMIDNDQSFTSVTPLDVLYQTLPERKVIGMRTFCCEMAKSRLLPNHRKELAQEGAFTEVERGGGGIICVQSEIWQKIPGPWFLDEYAKDEMGTKLMTEDYYFSDLVRKAGYKVWLHNSYMSHWHTLDLTDTALQIAGKK